MTTDIDGKTFLPLRIWGISLEYNPVRRGDITSLSYNSYSKVVHIEHELQHTGVVVTTETGYAKFAAIRAMITSPLCRARSWRKVSVRWTEWRRPDGRYDESEPVAVLVAESAPSETKGK